MTELPTLTVPTTLEDAPREIVDLANGVAHAIAKILMGQLNTAFPEVGSVERRDFAIGVCGFLLQYADAINPLTPAQLALAAEHGTPSQFNSACYAAVPSAISMEEAREAIAKYQAEWDEAGKVTQTP